MSTSASNEQQKEPLFFLQPTILVTGVKSFNDFLPVGNSTAQCINRLMRLAVVVAILVAIIFRSWWPIVTVGGLLLIAFLIGWGYQAYLRSRRERAIVQQALAERVDERVSTANEESRQERVSRTENASIEMPQINSQLLGDSRPSSSLYSTATTVDASEITDKRATKEKEENEEKADEKATVGEMADDHECVVVENDNPLCEFDRAVPLLPDCAVDHRYEQIVDEQRRLYEREFGARDCVVARLEQCAPYDPRATIPNPSCRSVVTPACQKPVNRLNNAASFSDGSCARNDMGCTTSAGGNSAADKEERAIAQARLQGNPSVGRVSSMIGLSATDANLSNLPNTYRKSSLNTRIDNIYDDVQRQGPSGTRARTTQMETGGQGRPVHDPTEKFLNSMWQDSTEQNWKTQFLDRRPAPWLNPADPTSRRLEEQAAASRSAYKSMNWNYGP